MFTLQCTIFSVLLASVRWSPRTSTVQTAGAAGDFATIKKRARYSALTHHYYFALEADCVQELWEVRRKVRERESDASGFVPESKVVQRQPTR